MTDQQQGSTSLAVIADNNSGVHHDIEVINTHLKECESKMNLIAPATRVGALPPGCGVSLSVLRVDPDPDNGDVYPVDGGKLALSKVVLDRLGAAVGVSWDPKESKRTDRGDHPHYWMYKAAGSYRQYDGSLTGIQNEYEFDVRDDSPRAVEATSEKALRTLRKFGPARAISGARCRALADIGIKRSYREAELKKPFVIARLHFDGHTDDPELKRIFAQQTSAAMLGGGGVLFGNQEPAPAALPANVVDTESEPENDTDGTATAKEVIDAKTGEVTQEEKHPGFLIPDGPAKGTPIEEADLLDVQYWARDTAPKEGDEQTELHAALTAELKRRDPDGRY